MVYGTHKCEVQQLLNWSLLTSWHSYEKESPASYFVFTYPCAHEGKWLGRMNIFTSSMWIWICLILGPQSQKYFRTWKFIRKYVWVYSCWSSSNFLHGFLQSLFLSHLFLLLRYSGSILIRYGLILFPWDAFFQIRQSASYKEHPNGDLSGLPSLFTRMASKNLNTERFVSASV